MRASFRNFLATFNIAAFVRNRHDHAMSVLRWTLILVPMAAAIGSLCAAFLWTLDVATRTRFNYPWLLYLLPLGGFAIGLLYHLAGKSVEGGNNLIVEQIHEPGGGIPLRMAPLIFIGTAVTHLFGGSAGREGTAVQLGGSLASAVGKWLRLDASGVRIILMAGVAAGFGAVFGTPLAGAVFALEVLAVGRVEYDSLVPCLVAGIVGDWTCQMWNVHHVAYHIDFLSGGTTPLVVDPLLLAKATIAGVAFGLAGLLFAEANHLLGGLIRKLVPFAPLRPFIGGLAVIGLVYVLGTRDYLGLGVWSTNPDAATISGFFAGPIDHRSWALKAVFTIVTLSSGFKGGEVTPLFFIGAALGNSLAGLLGAPVDLFAGLGFVAVFAGAANTPLACTIMGIELFGAAHMIPIAVACFVAYLCSGHSGIYLSQRIAVPKTTTNPIPLDTTLRDVRAVRPRPNLTDLFPSNPQSGDSLAMANPHEVVPNEIGMIRIYMKPSDKAPKLKGKGRLMFNSRPLYRELVLQAKSDGFMNAVAHHTHYGFSNHGPISENGAEMANPHLTMCVELIGQRGELEAFCRLHGNLLAEKVIVYKHLEHWSVSRAGIDLEDASETELHSEP